MTVVLRTSSWQIAMMILGGLLVTALLVAMDPVFPMLSIGLCSVLFVYLAWSYPLSSEVSAHSVVIRSLLRRRRIAWEEIVAIRRTRGPLRRCEINGRRRLRPSPGALLLVVEGRRSVLLSGQPESHEANRLLAELVSQASPALAEALRFDVIDGQ